jgi:hypothetical protein
VSAKKKARPAASRGATKSARKTQPFDPQELREALAKLPSLSELEFATYLAIEHLGGSADSGQIFELFQRHKTSNSAREEATPAKDTLNTILFRLHRDGYIERQPIRDARPPNPQILWVLRFPVELVFERLFVRFFDLTFVSREHPQMLSNLLHRWKQHAIGWLEFDSSDIEPHLQEIYERALEASGGVDPFAQKFPPLLQELHGRH